MSKPKCFIDGCKKKKDVTTVIIKFGEQGSEKAFIANMCPKHLSDYNGGTLEEDLTTEYGWISQEGEFCIIS